MQDKLIELIAEALEIDKSEAENDLILILKIIGTL